MTLTILSKYSKTTQKLVKEQMRQEAEERGFDPYDDSGQEEFERRVMDLEQQSLEHPEIDWEVKYWELAGHRWSIFIILRLGIFFFFYSLN